MQVKIYPNSLSICQSAGGLTALFTYDAKPKHGTRTPPKNTQPIQTSVELDTTLTTDTATSSEPSTPVVPPRKYALISFSVARKARKRDATLTTNLESTTSPPQVAMDGQLKEMLASMQNEMREMRRKNGDMHDEIRSIHKEHESIRKENETIHKDLAGVQKDLDPAKC
ncbi:hypothetical protein BDR07DRAFT_1383990 [Suillus spraguei]|nr:hypothetical protein BDR07DRAFT_1383990 [Suillus spraguei]